MQLQGQTFNFRFLLNSQDAQQGKVLLQNDIELQYIIT